MTSHRLLALLSVLGLASPALAAPQSAPAPLAAAPAAVAPAPIARVVVYSDRAQVTRTQTADCARGEAVFPGLPPTLDVRTLAPAVAGDGAVEGIGHAEEATDPRPQVEALLAKVRALDEKLAEARSLQEAAYAVEQKLHGFRGHLQRTWGEQAVGALPPTTSWDAALDLLRAQALGAAHKRALSEARLRELNRERQALLEDLQRVRDAGRRTSLRVTVFVRCRGQQKVTLAYVVPGATWRVAYQAHAEPAQRKVTVQAQAIVQQGTGEDWSGVKLAVSTANLQRQTVPPTIGRMYVSTFKPPSPEKVLTRRFERREHLTTVTVSADKAKDVGGAPAGPGAPPAEEAGAVMELEALAKATVPSDGREVLVVLARETQSADFTLETVPKLYPYVYERATIHNPFNFPMLPGPLSVHRGRAFVGQTVVKLRAPREPFALSLGVSAEVLTDRFVKVERLDGPGTLGSSKKLRHRYEIEVGNWTGEKRRVRVLENLPVAQVADIDVRLDDDCTPPSSWNRPDGILTWDVDLAPRSKKTVVVSFTVTLPAEYKVYGY